MTREEAASILAHSLLAAGYHRTDGSRPAFTDPDGYRATRGDLRGHVAQTYRGDDRDPFLDFLRPGSNHWPLVDKAATEILASP